MKYITIILTFGFCLLCSLTNVEPSSNRSDKFWKANQPLDWIHFQGKPDYDTEYVAVTVSMIEQTINCDEHNNFTCDIKAKFSCYKSWTITEKAHILIHEQKHFDLTEIYARKLRREYSRLNNPCQYTLKELTKIYDHFFEELQIVQNQYDAETNHGINISEQIIWNAKIKKDLNKLSKYERLHY